MEGLSIELESQEQKREVKEGVDFLFKKHPELSVIGTEEQYSQYLETIFPESELQDIAYHGTNVSEAIAEEGFDTSKMKRSKIGIGINFSLNKNHTYEFGGDMIAAMINVHDFIEFKNPVVSGLQLSEKQIEALHGYLHTKRGFTDSVLELKKYLEERGDIFQLLDGFLRDNNQDIAEVITILNSLDIRGTMGQLTGNNVITVNNIEDIHILASKQDLKGFKNFISNSSN